MTINAKEKILAKCRYLQCKQYWKRFNRHFTVSWRNRMCPYMYVIQEMSAKIFFQTVKILGNHCTTKNAAGFILSTCEMDMS